jgi:predicted nucleic acid-binding Zn ribbon protein
MKNHDIHENKNVCPEFNGEKMHEQQKRQKALRHKDF